MGRTETVWKPAQYLPLDQTADFEGFLFCIVFFCYLGHICKMGITQARPAQARLPGIPTRQEALRKTKRLGTLRDLDFVVLSSLGLVQNLSDLSLLICGTRHSGTHCKNKTEGLRDDSAGKSAGHINLLAQVQSPGPTQR